MGLIKVIDRESNEISWQESNDSEVVHGVDQAGNYVGLIDKNFLGLYNQVLCAPPSNTSDWRWESGSWKYYKPLALAIAESLEMVDILAGGARSRYITTTPGQDMVYSMKKSQAEDYSSMYYINPDYTPIPAFVQSEAMASNCTNIEAAELIIAKAAEWEAKAVEIENIRRSAKVVVSSCTSIEELNSVMDDTRTSLNLV